MAQFQRNTQAQAMTRLTERLGIAVIIKLKEHGEVRGVVETTVSNASKALNTSAEGFAAVESSARSIV